MVEMYVLIKKPSFEGFLMCLTLIGHCLEAEVVTTFVPKKSG